MIVVPPAVVVDVRGDQMLRHGFNRVDDVAVDVRVAEVEADARFGAEIVQRDVLFDEMHERAGAGQLVRQHFHGDSHPERLRQPHQLLDAAPRRRARVLWADLRIPRLVARHPEVRDQHRHGDAPRDVQRPLGLANRPRPRAGVDAGDRQRPAPAPAGELLRDRRVDAAQLEAGLGQPLLQVGDRRRVVVVEVRARGEDLDQLETVRRDLQQVIPGQSLIVEEVRRHPVLPFSHQAKHLF